MLGSVPNCRIPDVVPFYNAGLKKKELNWIIITDYYSQNVYFRHQERQIKKNNLSTLPADTEEEIR